MRWNEVTGGEDGLAGFARQDIHLGNLIPITLDGTGFYYLVLICFTVAVAIMWAILQSPLGHTWVAIRENRRRMEFLGIRVERYVWAAFAIAGFITAFAGTLNALLFNFTSPQDLHWILSGNFVIMIVLGGMRSFFGPLLGVIIFVVAQDYLSSVTGNWMTFIGMMFVLIVLLFPKGVLGIFDRRAEAEVDVTRMICRHPHARPGVHGRVDRSCGWTTCRAISARLKAVDDVSFEMAAGELRAVIGPNGAGKTTFFNLISGLLPPTAGTCRFEGDDITAPADRRTRVAGHRAHVPDHRNPAGPERVREYPRRRRNRGGAELPALDRRERARARLTGASTS